MSKKHDALYDDVLGNLDAPEPAPAAAEVARGSRFLKRSTTIADHVTGEIEEKTLRWVDPADCVMWDRHNRAYDLLTEENCRDLIDGIRAQGRQEFPAIVRRKGDAYEVICAAALCRQLAAGEQLHPVQIPDRRARPDRRRGVSPGRHRKPRPRGHLGLRARD